MSGDTFCPIIGIKEGRFEIYNKKIVNANKLT